ncbi:signal recognition particle protein Srp54 [Cuniculiplasma sp. SKW3]|uniref:signal recognition particle protein Srp54 n=1 Tax=unclassified Cuniculiplasma TaxID=2619706 RepID=UPI003FD544F0
MVLESLSSSLRETFRKIAGSSYIDKDVIREMIKEIQRALLKSDVNVKLTVELTRRIQERAENEKPPAGMPPQDYILKIVYEELLGILGQGSQLKLQPQKIMLLGLYANGKTTTAGKLAKFFAKKGLNSGLIACDVHRPAAYEQLKTIADQSGSKFFGIKGEKDPIKIYRKGAEELKDVPVKIIDTSGRDSLDEQLLEEVRKLKKEVEPDEILLVMDATIGQQAGPQAKALKEAAGITGVIITKMDGTGKGGGALSAVAETGAPVYMIGTGEHLDDFEIFNPKKFLSRLLGMGDAEALLEVAQEADVDEEKAEETLTKIMNGKFNLMDMYDIWEKFAKPSIMKRLFDSLPMGKIPQSKAGLLDVDSAQAKIQKYRVILDSMTYRELENPDIINAKVIRRVARGSGTEEQDVRNLMKEFKAMKENAKMMKGNRALKKMLKNQMKGSDLLSGIDLEGN